MLDFIAIYGGAMVAKKTLITLSIETHRELLKYISKLMVERGRRVSYDEAIRELLSKIEACEKKEAV